VLFQTLKIGILAYDVTQGRSTTFQVNAYTNEKDPLKWKPSIWESDWIEARPALTLGPKMTIDLVPTPNYKSYHIITNYNYLEIFTLRSLHNVDYETF